MPPDGNQGQSSRAVDGPLQRLVGRRALLSPLSPLRKLEPLPVPADTDQDPVLEVQLQDVEKVVALAWEERPGVSVIDVVKGPVLGSLERLKRLVDVKAVCFFRAGKNYREDIWFGQADFKAVRGARGHGLFDVGELEVREDSRDEKERDAGQRRSDLCERLQLGSRRPTEWALSRVRGTVASLSPLSCAPKRTTVRDPPACGRQLQRLLWCEAGLTDATGEQSDCPPVFLHTGAGDRKRMGP
jgi:hypothetical protein